MKAFQRLPEDSGVRVPILGSLTSRLSWCKTECSHLYEFICLVT